jgi:hypothetical protein
MPPREARPALDNRVATSRANFNRYSLSFARSHILIIREHELRRDLAPDMLVDVEVLDVTEEEARVLGVRGCGLGVRRFQRNDWSTDSQMDCIALASFTHTPHRLVPIVDQIIL